MNDPTVRTSRCCLALGVALLAFMVVIAPSPATEAATTDEVRLDPTHPLILNRMTDDAVAVLDWFAVVEFEGFPYVRLTREFLTHDGKSNGSISMDLFAYRAPLVALDTNELLEQIGAQLEPELMSISLEVKRPRDESGADEGPIGAAAPPCFWLPVPTPGPASCQMQVCAHPNPNCIVLTKICCVGGSETECTRSIYCGGVEVETTDCTLPGNPCLFNNGPLAQ